MLQVICLADIGRSHLAKAGSSCRQCVQTAILEPQDSQGLFAVACPLATVPLQKPLCCLAGGKAADTKCSRQTQFTHQTPHILFHDFA